MDHLNQIQRAVDYIEENLTAPADELRIEQIARKAGYSTWHFQRVFAAFVGDSVKGYVRRRRLSAAFMALTGGPARILDVALEHGFESQESFTRAFKELFGINPGELRKSASKAIVVPLKPRITLEYLEHLNGGMSMQPVIRQVPQMRIVGMGTRFISIRSPERNNFDVLPPLWKRYLARESEIPGRKGAGHVGVCQDIRPPETKSHPEELYYMAGTEVEEGALAPDGMELKVIPAGRYAIFTHRGTLESLGHTMSYIFGSWLARSGETLRDAPDLEVYDGRFDPKSPDSEVDLYIPIA
jgi:AraC family transcriptional regulator